MREPNALASTRCACPYPWSVRCPCANVTSDGADRLTTTSTREAADAGVCAHVAAIAQATATATRRLRVAEPPIEFLDALRPRAVAASVGFVPTAMPRASSASFFACAVPAVPEMIAPACPIVLPGGAVKPAMYATTGFVMCSPM